MQSTSMDRQQIFMTGATSGLGKVAAITLANEGHHIIVACRDKTKGKALVEATTGTIDLVECDLASFASMQKACKEIMERFDQLDQLILNAGVWTFDRRESEDGIEEIFQVNLLAPLFMIHALSPLMTNAQHSKVIITASALHGGVIQFEDLEYKEKFSGFKAYQQSKLGVILMTRYLEKELDKIGVGIYSQHPGVVQTELGRHAGWFSRMIFKLIGKSPAKGARTLLYLSKTPKAELTSGAYYANRKLTKSGKESYNMEVARKLVKRLESYLFKLEQMSKS